MIRTIIISPDREMPAALESILEETGHIHVARVVEEYPAAIDLIRALRAHATEVVFLSFESVEKACQIAKLLETEASHVQIVAINRTMDSEVLRESMRVGIREFLAYPFSRQNVLESLGNVKTLLEARPASYAATNDVFCFLPSKAGSGASTVALNVTAAIARIPKRKVLLSDFDLNSGMLRFMLKLNDGHSVIEAVEQCFKMDEHLWPQLVTSVAGLDVLHAGPVNPSYRIEPSQIRDLMGFMRRTYNVLSFDLSGNLEKYSIELMQESKQVFLVCTPEISSLHLAREKLQFLNTLDLAGRVAVIMNRVPKKASLFSAKEVQSMLQVPVIASFPNNYQEVSRALTEGTLVAPASDLGKAFSEFAGSLFQQKVVQPKENSRKFLDFFSVAPRLPVSTGL